VVDDEEELRELIRHVLERAGHLVTCAHNGREASLVIARGQFDVVVTDILMPDRDGMELITEIAVKYPGVKMMAMSGGGQIGSDQYLSMAKGLESTWTRVPMAPVGGGAGKAASLGGR
jgi:DNA-binding NtrC family response regulator